MEAMLTRLYRRETNAWQNAENAGWSSAGILDLVMAKIHLWEYHSGNADIVATLFEEDIEHLLREPIFEQEARERARCKQVDAGQRAMPWW